MTDSVSRQIRTIIHQINLCWQNGRPHDIFPYLHPDIVMVFPGFSGRSQGAGQIIAGFRDFCDNAVLVDFTESDYQIDVFESTAICSYSFNLIFQRSGKTYRSTGRDVWIFQSTDDGWKAVWRTMSDLAETEVVVTTEGK